MSVVDVLVSEWRDICEGELKIIFVSACSSEDQEVG